MTVDQIIDTLDEGHITHDEATKLIREQLEKAAACPLYKKKGYKAKPMAERLLSHKIIGPIDLAMETPCWLWDSTHKHTVSGEKSYPMFSVGRRQSPVHAVRAAYQYLLGIKPPSRESGMTVSHLCATGAQCWNPSHTIIESFQDNVARMPKELRKKICAKMRTYRAPGTRPKQFCRRGHVMAKTRVSHGKKQTRCGVCEYIRQAIYDAGRRKATALKKCLKANRLVLGEVWTCDIISK